MVILTQEELFSEMTDPCDKPISHNAPYLLVILEASASLESFEEGNLLGTINFIPMVLPALMITCFNLCQY